MDSYGPLVSVWPRSLFGPAKSSQMRHLLRKPLESTVLNSKPAASFPRVKRYPTFMAYDLVLVLPLPLSPPSPTHPPPHYVFPSYTDYREDNFVNKRPKVPLGRVAAERNSHERLQSGRMEFGVWRTMQQICMDTNTQTRFLYHRWDHVQGWRMSIRIPKPNPTETKEK